ncbi:MAG: Rrf2 family transcriptional regulator [Puniceicoccales bacterium]|jgi:Rrf2 family protein|nr:Rrf2 family transcriptional regulator [Puniceicoccales bacterium]
MKISLKLEYACRSLAQIGRLYGSGQLAHIEELAKSEKIPQNYLIQILNELRAGGILRSKRGKNGGYALVRRPSDTSLLDVAEIVDNDLVQHRLHLDGVSGAQVAEVWNGIANRFRTVLKKTTVADLIPRYDGATMYDI